MPELIAERHATVAKAAKRAKRSGVVSDFHRLRIRCKRLRYALEFSSEVYGGRSVRYVRRLTALQDELGLMQDAEVAALRLAELATGEVELPASTVFVMGGVAERHRREVARLLELLPKALARVGGREWRDLVQYMERRRTQAEADRPPVRSTLRALPPPSTATGGEDVAPDVAPAVAEPTEHPAGPPGLTALAPPPSVRPPSAPSPLAPPEPHELGRDG